MDNCSGCHGDEGRGDGPGAQWLRPQPTNLTAREYSRGRLADILWNGVHGSAMPAWRDQAPENLAALANMVLEFSDIDEQITPTPGELRLGERVYQTNCSECHGEDGGGDGFAANDFPITPSDFQGERVSYAESVRIVRNGVDGTSMAPWTDRLDDEEILAVAHYVRQFFAGSDYGTGASL